MFTKDSTKNDYSKLIKNYIRNKCPTQPDYIHPIKMALHKSGYDNYELFVDASEKLILLDSDKDITSGLVIKDNEIVDFKNSTDWEAVSVDVCARYNILKHISNGEDLRNVREIFRKKRTWLIHYEKTEDGRFNAHTHGLDSYGHPDFRINKDIGVEATAYLFNSLCRSIQRGNAYRSGDTVVDLYDNCNILITRAADGYFDINFVLPEFST